MLLVNAIGEPKQRNRTMLNIAVFGQKFCTIGNIFPLYANYFPIFSIVLPLNCVKDRLNGDRAQVRVWGISTLESEPRP